MGGMKMGSGPSQASFQALRPRGGCCGGCGMGCGAGMPCGGNMRLWRDEVGVAGPRGMGMPNSMMQQQMAQMSSMMMPMMMATALSC